MNSLFRQNYWKLSFFLLMGFFSCSSLKFLPPKYSFPSTEYVDKRLSDQSRQIVKQKRELEELQAELDSVRVSATKKEQIQIALIDSLKREINTLKKRYTSQDSLVETIITRFDSLEKDLTTIERDSKRLKRIFVLSEGNEVEKDSSREFSAGSGLQSRILALQGEALRMDRRIDTVYQDLHIVEDSFMELLRLGQQQSKADLENGLLMFKTAFSRESDTLLTLIQQLDSSVTVINNRLEKINSRLENQDLRIDLSDAGLDSLASRLQNLEEELNAEMENLNRGMEKVPETTILKFIQIMEKYISEQNMSSSIDSLQNNLSADSLRRN